MRTLAHPSAHLLVLAVLALSGCTSKIESDLSVDGDRFEPAECRSGQRWNFAGVELQDKAGRRLRLVADPSGQALAVLLPAEAGAAAVELGRCGPMTLDRQSSTINDIRNVKGWANLDCSAGGHGLKGSVKFENCH